AGYAQYGPDVHVRLGAGQSPPPLEEGGGEEREPSGGECMRGVAEDDEEIDAVLQGVEVGSRRALREFFPLSLREGAGVRGRLLVAPLLRPSWRLGQPQARQREEQPPQGRHEQRRPPA